MIRRSMWSTLCGAAALLLAAVPVVAQAPAGGAGTGGARQGRGQARGRAVSLATLPANDLAPLLKLTDDQKSKVAAIQEKLATDSRPLRAQRGQPANPENREKLAALNKQATTDIEAVLTQEQKDRFKALALEIRMYRAAGLPVALIPELKLTAEQKTKIADIEKAAAPQPGAQPADRRAARQKEREDILAVLTPEQKAALDKYEQAHPRARGRRQP